MIFHRRVRRERRAKNRDKPDKKIGRIKAENARKGGKYFYFDQPWCKMERTMRLALETANDLEKLGLIGKHAIIGSVAVIYYAGPISTDDLDICFLHGQSKDTIFSMKPIYDYLQSKGFKPVDFTVMVGGVKVQFIPSTGPLSDEAISNARELTLFATPAHVVTPEYLLAMKLEASRPKDYVHIIHLLDNSRDPIDLSIAEKLFSKFKLTDQWDKFLSSTLWKKK